MPIDIEQVKPDVFVLKWDGHVTIEEMRASHEKTAHITEQIGISRYVHIITVSETMNFKPNAREATKILQAYPNLVGLIAVEGTLIMNIMITVINQLFPNITLTSADDLEDALHKADMLLDKREEVK